MHFTQVLALASSAALVAAAPAPITVSVDDVILYGKNGRFTMMKRDELEELKKLRESGIAPPKPGYLDETLVTLPVNETDKPEGTLQKRATSLIIPNPHSRFLGWDVQTSQVVKGAPTTISISTGYSITNSISVSQGASFTLVKDFLSASLSINYSTSWQTSQTQLFSAAVPEGKYGAFVTNAWTNRESGNVWEGTIGGEGSLTYYQADSFESKSYGDMSWVDGVISLCTGDTFPLKRCVGDEWETLQTRSYRSMQATPGANGLEQSRLRGTPALLLLALLCMKH
ncbi:hypothetical protein BU25DRAFT_450430 [Macroventuria anomochaeta]|uniref:Uncharacterized protein n=1 Tax=Macroventuria anomochaeta TaxID=301207 RepID=A0ACB6RUQ2_9PLEO|nr:uncharacterized protein BU25DRAFT_450430 [Macroventuria anomochaeta]KAF2624669.1 hypothetical protein BU25DRAFT_450430 [Macroventuria anomochaeta]